MRSALGSLRRARFLAAASVCLALLSCGRGRTYLETVDIPGDRPTNEKVELARSMATRESYERLLGETRRRFPSLTERQLKKLVLTWRVYRPPSSSAPAPGPIRERVAMVVGFRDADPSFDPRPVVDYCKQVLANELGAAEGR